ncbi:hypothetical protein SANTM175S_04402 [Streptomyces antimycoticus]
MPGDLTRRSAGPRMALKSARPARRKPRTVGDTGARAGDGRQPGVGWCRTSAPTCQASPAKRLPLVAEKVRSRRPSYGSRWPPPRSRWWRGSSPLVEQVLTDEQAHRTGRLRYGVDRLAEDGLLPLPADEHVLVLGDPVLGQIQQPVVDEEAGHDRVFDLAQVRRIARLDGGVHLGVLGAVDGRDLLDLDPHLGVLAVPQGDGLVDARHPGPEGQGDLLALLTVLGFPAPVIVRAAAREGEPGRRGGRAAEDGAARRAGRPCVPVSCGIAHTSLSTGMRRNVMVE